MKKSPRFAQQGAHMHLYTVLYEFLAWCVIYCPQAMNRCHTLTANHSTLVWGWGFVWGVQQSSSLSLPSWCCCFLFTMCPLDHQPRGVAWSLRRLWAKGDSLYRNGPGCEVRSASHFAPAHGCAKHPLLPLALQLCVKMMIFWEKSDIQAEPDGRSVSWHSCPCGCMYAPAMWENGRP